MGHGELGAGGRGMRHTGVLRVGRAGAGGWARRGWVRVLGRVNGLESRRTGRAAHARQVIWTRGRCDGIGCACGAGKSADGGRLHGCPGASTAVPNLGSGGKKICSSRPLLDPQIFWPLVFPLPLPIPVGPYSTTKLFFSCFFSTRLFFARAGTDFFPTSVAVGLPDAGMPQASSPHLCRNERG